jgi:predicted transcriptional regulator
MPYKKTGTSKPMKLVTVWLTEDEKATLDELAEEQKITLSYALREGLKLYFDEACDWIEGSRTGPGEAKPA